MKNYLFTIALFSAVTLADAQDGRFVLDGVVRGMPEGKAILSFLTFSDAQVIAPETTVVKDGRFQFNGRLSAPVLAGIYLLPGKFRMSIFLENAHISATADTTAKSEG
ncbi:MAG TPA: DUF4369 domain-containing protein, partial [Bacteroidota bacterium]|nr:DUF4369 domain-containing protein [Bacteroidota bacterium]